MFCCTGVHSTELSDRHESGPLTVIGSTGFRPVCFADPGWRLPQASVLHIVTSKAFWELNPAGGPAGSGLSHHRPRKNFFSGSGGYVRKEAVQDTSLKGGR